MPYESCGGTGLEVKVKFKVKFTVKVFLKIFMPRVSLPALCALLEEHVCLVLLELCVGCWQMRRMRIALPLLRWSWCRTL